MRSPTCPLSCREVVVDEGEWRGSFGRRGGDDTASNNGGRSLGRTIVDMSTVEDLFAQRKALAERFSVAPVAFSSDGHEVGFAGPIDLGVEVGGLALVETP